VDVARPIAVPDQRLRSERAWPGSGSSWDSCGGAGCTRARRPPP
jgi:hypothetical protein